MELLMNRISLAAAGLLCAALAACGSDVPAAIPDTDSVLLVDAIPSGYVKTPHGLYHQSCVHELPDGAELDASGNVVLEDGTAMPALATCGYQRAMLNAAVSGPVTNGWVEYAAAFAPLPITKMTSKFTVPAAPAESTGQLVYFFPGVEPLDGTIILQPVLQWGTSPAGGGNSWGIASWSCGPQCVHSKLVAVNAGDSITGSITGSNCNAAGACSWKIYSNDTTTGHATTLSTKGDTKAYTWMQSGVLEAYNVSGCGQYPSASEVFSKVAFYTAKGLIQAPAWQPAELGTQPSCNFNVTTSATGATLAY
jgi:hypothetical protein